MKSLSIYILIIISISITLVENKKFDPYGEKKTIDPSEILDGLEILKKIRPESDSFITNKYDQVGFKKIHNIFDYSYGAVFNHNLDKQFQIWLEDDIFNFISQKDKSKIFKSIEEYTIQFNEEPFHKQKLEITFNEGKGTLIAFLLKLTPHPTKPNVIKWEKYIISSEFEAAQSFIIMTKSKCNILSCKRKDEIVYLPGLITNEHLKSIVDSIKYIVDLNDNLKMNANQMEKISS